ncbi:MAG: hypothetical protein OES24_05565 [Acidimicrobiia bacterium]|nr:hypothetical protein [Acidimicrobiia bacterium]
MSDAMLAPIEVTLVIPAVPRMVSVARAEDLSHQLDRSPTARELASYLAVSTADRPASKDGPGPEPDQAPPD